MPSKTIGGGTKIDNSDSRRVRMPALYSIAIYDRHGTPLFFREWSRPQGVKDMREEHKLMFGFLFSLKQLVGKMSPKKYAPCFTPRKKGVALRLTRRTCQTCALLAGVVDSMRAAQAHIGCTTLRRHQGFGLF